MSKLDSLSQIPGFRWACPACPSGTDNFQATTTPLQFNHPFLRRLFRRKPEQTAEGWIDTNDLAFGSWPVVIPTGTSWKSGTKYPETLMLSLVSGGVLAGDFHSTKW